MKLLQKVTGSIFLDIYNSIKDTNDISFFYIITFLFDTLLTSWPSQNLIYHVFGFLRDSNMINRGSKIRAE